VNNNQTIRISAHGQTSDDEGIKGVTVS